MPRQAPAPLVFGVFPLGIAGAPGGVAAGPPDDMEAITSAVATLAGDGPPLLPRMYINWAGRRDTGRALDVAAQLAGGGIGWDLALCFRDRRGRVDPWCDFVAEVVRRHGRSLAAVQVTGEANLRGVPGAADGAYKNAATALARGVPAAAAAKRESGATAAIGFAAVPDWWRDLDFWTALGRDGGPEFAAGLDYAGLDLYPDVFGPPLEPAAIGPAVAQLVGDYRRVALPAAGIGPDVPIRICENGWPTGPDRPEERQAEVLETVIRTLHGVRGELNVTHWELFTLRDADSGKDDLFHRFGVLRDDYTPKPAFHTLVRLIGELGR